MVPQRRESGISSYHSTTYRKGYSMKRLLSVFLALVLIFSTFALAASSLPGSVKGYPVSTANFKVYSSYSTTSAKVGTCFYDDYITIKDVRNGWAKISYPTGSGSKTGWVESKYVLLNDSFSSGKAQSTIKVYTTE